MSQSSHGLKIKAEFVAKDKDGNLIGKSVIENDKALIALQAWLRQALFADVTESAAVNDISGAPQNIAVDTGITVVGMMAGATIAVPGFTDNAIAGYAAGGSYDATAVTVVASAANVFTVTALFTNSTLGDLVYGTAGLTATGSTGTFLFTGDEVNGAGGYTISTLGTLSATLTVTLT
jgi:hypothetical protein